MAVQCSCGDGVAFAGWNSSDQTQNEIVSLIFVNTIADDGTVNGILKTDVLSQAYTDALFNNADKSKRWNSINDITAFDDTTTDPNFVQDTNGTNYVVGGGSIKTVKGELWKKSARYGKQISPFFCGENQSFYMVDKCGVLVGELSNDGLSILPITISSGSGFVQVMNAKSGEVGRLMFQFDVKYTSDDLDIVLINSSVIDADLTAQQSIEGVNGVLSSITTGGFVIDMSGNFGFTNEENKIVGVLVGDITVKNASTGASETVTVLTPSVVVGEENKYTATISPILTAATDYTVEMLRDGFEMLPTTFTTP